MGVVTTITKEAFGQDVTLHGVYGRLVWAQMRPTEDGAPWMADAHFAFSRRRRGDVLFEKAIAFEVDPDQSLARQAYAALTAGLPGCQPDTLAMDSRGDDIEPSLVSARRNAIAAVSDDADRKLDGAAVEYGRRMGLPPMPVPRIVQAMQIKAMDIAARRAANEAIEDGDAAAEAALRRFARYSDAVRKAQSEHVQAIEALGVTTSPPEGRTPAEAVLEYPGAAVWPPL